MVVDGVEVSAERLVDAAIELIGERGGSHGMNLREVARRVGCAHTNVYNYFDSLDDLTMAALRRALVMYIEQATGGLDDGLSPKEYLRRLVTNLALFPQQHPGLARFINTDPIDVAALPVDVLDTVISFKRWLLEVFAVLCGPEVASSDVEDLCNITTGYIDGETVNLINGRVVPGEDIAGRMVDNAIRLFEWVTGDASSVDSPGAYPQLVVPLADSHLAVASNGGTAAIGDERRRRQRWHNERSRA